MGPAAGSAQLGRTNCCESSLDSANRQPCAEHAECGQDVFCTLVVLHVQEHPAMDTHGYLTLRAWPFSVISLSLQPCTACLATASHLAYQRLLLCLHIIWRMQFFRIVFNFSFPWTIQRDVW
jgi:hypothetical protein